MDKILVADIGLEGGGTTIYGRQQDGIWSFWQEGSSMGLDDDDNEFCSSWKSQPVQDLSLALPHDWPMFYPSKINTEFLDWFRNNYDAACSQLTEDLRHPSGSTAIQPGCGSSVYRVKKTSTLVRNSPLSLSCSMTLDVAPARNRPEITSRFRN